MVYNSHIIKRSIKKAKQSPSTFRISALGFNKNGDCVISKTNKPRFNRFGGGYHAEREIMKVANKMGIVRILICRVGRGGDLLPIEPCNVCQSIADKLGIKIDTIKVNNET